MEEKVVQIAKSATKIWSYQKIIVPLHPHSKTTVRMLVEFDRDLAQLVAHTSGGREVAGSSPVIPTENERIERFPRFFVLCMQVLSATHACESFHSKVYRHLKLCSHRFASYLSRLPLFGHLS